MKRFIGIMMVMGVVLFTGCGNSNTISRVDNLIETSENFDSSKVSENDDFYNSILLEKEKTFTWIGNSQSYSCSIFGYSECTQECLNWVEDLPGIDSAELNSFQYNNYDCLILRKENVSYTDEFGKSHILKDTYVVSLIQDRIDGIAFTNFALNVDGEDKIALPVHEGREGFFISYNFLIENGLIEKNKHYAIS